MMKKEKIETSSKNKLVIYTCVTGGYDGLYNHMYHNPQWDYVCFTDDVSIASDVNATWDIRPLQFHQLDNIRNQRWHKIHPHELFPEYEKSLWIDGNIDILTDDISKDVDRMISLSRDIAIAPHPIRQCVYQELDTCINYQKDDVTIMKEQVRLMREGGFPENYGMFETNILYRNHHQNNVKKVMKEWWCWIEEFSYRDQLSLTYALWKNDVTAYPLSNTPYNQIGDRRIAKVPHGQDLRPEVIALSQKIHLMEQSKFWKFRNSYIRGQNGIKFIISHPITFIKKHLT